MLKNYFKTAWRNLWKYKTASTINILGLTIGLTCCLLISLYIRQECSFDKSEKNGDRIARVIMEYSFTGSDATAKGNFTSVRVVSVFKRNFPEVEDAIKMKEDERVVHYGNSLQVSDDSIFYHITGIMEDCPSNSQIQYDFLASFSSFGISPERENSYWNANYTTYPLYFKYTVPSNRWYCLPNSSTGSCWSN